MTKRVLPERLLKASLLLFMLSNHTVQASLELSGITRSGMSFSGRIAAIGESSLFLDSGEKGSVLQVGIPLVEIAELKIHIPWQVDRSFLIELERSHGIVPYLSDTSLREVMEAVMPLASSWSWENAYTWANRFYKSTDSKGLQTIARLHKCRAMMELGLFQQLQMELDILNNSVDPIEASPILCWLNAELLLNLNQPEKALFWAMLPTLQIPRYSGSLMARLEKIQQSLESEP